MPTVDDLRKYYKASLEKKVFFDKKTASGVTYYVMYLHDAKKEKEYFGDTFSLYFPYYIWSEDYLDTLDISIGLENSLKRASKNCWNSEIVAKRKIQASGIYGELFLDFYERIVHDKKLITTYATRRAYTDKTESRGYDHIGYILNNGNLEIVIGEAKFVTNVSSACTSLKNDINGIPTTEPGHLTVDYFNSFFNFVVSVNKQFSEKERNDLRVIMRDLNSLLVNGGKTFLQYIIDNNIKVNVVLFAVFSDNREEPNDLMGFYKQLYDEANKALINMGVTSFSVEIVFVPTKATSMEIKEKIDGFYR